MVTPNSFDVLASLASNSLITHLTGLAGTMNAGGALGGATVGDYGSGGAGKVDCAKSHYGFAFVCNIEQLFPSLSFNVPVPSLIACLQPCIHP